MQSDPQEEAELGEDGEHEHHEGIFDPAGYRPSKSRILVNVMVGGLLLAGLVIAGLVPRFAEKSRAIEDRRRVEAHPPRVHVMKPQVADVGTISLPGSVTPFQETIIYARVNGYLHKYRVDIGDRLKKGQIIAEIETPDLDQQVEEAHAMVGEARANVELTKAQLKLAQLSNTRFQSLRPTGVISEQTGDERQAQLDVQIANLGAKQAGLNSAEASARHLDELKRFSTLVAPFDGVITSRTTEEGQLVSVGQANPIFKFVRTDLMRVFINVPQLYVASIHVGDKVPMTLREFPGRTFMGVIDRTTSELDTATRTLITQVNVENPDGALVPGMYATVRLPGARSNAPLMVPATAVMFDAEGTRAALVENGEIHWHTVTIDSDQGATVVITQGLKESDVVVIMPTYQLTERLKVDTVEGSIK